MGVAVRTGEGGGDVTNSIAVSDLVGDSAER